MSFIVKNTDTQPHLLHEKWCGQVLFLNLEAGKEIELHEDFRSYFEQNEVSWAAILPVGEPIVIESIGKPVVKKPGRPRKKRS